MIFTFCFLNQYLNSPKAQSSLRLNVLELTPLEVCASFKKQYYVIAVISRANQPDSDASKTASPYNKRSYLWRRRQAGEERTNITHKYGARGDICVGRVDFLLVATAAQ